MAAPRDDVERDRVSHQLPCPARRRHRSRGVVLAPAEARRGGDPTQLVGIVLVDDPHQHLAHHAGGGPVVGRPVSPPPGLHGVVADQPHPVGVAGEAMRPGDRSPGPAEQRGAHHDQAGHQVGTVRRQHDGDPPPEAVADQHRRVQAALLEQPPDGGGVVGAPPRVRRGRRGPEAGQIHRQDPMVADSPDQVTAITSPAVQCHHQASVSAGIGELGEHRPARVRDEGHRAYSSRSVSPRACRYGSGGAPGSRETTLSAAFVPSPAAPAPPPARSAPSVGSSEELGGGERHPDGPDVEVGGLGAAVAGSLHQRPGVGALEHHQLRPVRIDDPVAG